MPEFLDVLETIRAEDASAQRIYAGDGRSVRGMHSNGPQYQQRLAEAATLIADVLDGRRPAYRLQEAFSTSDFPLLFGDIIDRQLLASYKEIPPVWQSIAQRKTVNDFRTVKMFMLDGAEAVLLEVAQLDEYKGATLTESKYELTVKKYGRRLPFSWESFVNNDLDALRSMPARLAKAARMSESRFVTDMYAGTTGPDGTFFASGNANIVTSNPALSVTALQTAFTVLSKQRDADGNPIFIDNVLLVVPPALEVVARNIVNAIEIRQAAGSGASGADSLTAVNWMKNRITVVVDPWLPVISTTNGDTSWYLIADPADRPAIMIGFLRGHETPEVFVKAQNAVRIGGGIAGVEEGDFDTDAVEYKVRHVFGGVLGDPKMAVASNGTGS